MDIIFWAEVHQKIGMGHFFESLTLSKFFLKNNHEVQFLINEYQPIELLLEKHRIRFKNFNTIIRPDFFEQNDKSHTSIVFVNHRSVSLENLIYLKELGYYVVVIDQLGNKPIVADILINTSIVEDWRQYIFPENKPECFFGPEYAILQEFYRRDNNKKDNNLDRSVFISMGGVDRTGATLRIISALRNTPNILKRVVIGPGFSKKEELNQIIKKLDSSFHFVFNETDLSNYMKDAALAFSAGGNTLYELACMGVPTLVLWEDNHEMIFSECMEAAGCVKNIGNGMQISEEEILKNVCKVLDSELTRMKMTEKNLQLVDGKGCERIFKKTIQYLN